jgi:hypothetical protein
MFHLDEPQAMVYFFGMLVHVLFKIGEPLRAQTVQELFDAAVILFP